MKPSELMARPTIFIGSTKEGLELAEALQQDLEHAFEVQLWTQDVFKPSHSTLEDLVGLSSKVDCAALILTSDDVRRSRGRQSSVPRDNLIFELGLFMGALDRDRVFAIVPRKDRPVLPSDLFGITVIEYTEPQGFGWPAALGPAATRIKNAQVRQSQSEDLGGCRAYEEELPTRQIAVCSVEATFRGHVPLRELGCVLSCLENAIKVSSNAVKQSADCTEDRALCHLWEKVCVNIRGSIATLTWELPQGTQGKKLEIALAIRILDFISLLQRQFRKNLRDLGVPFREHVSKVDLRIALSTGKALLRRSEFLVRPDYAGPCLEEVAGLRKATEPGGVIASIRLAPYLFMERLCAREGDVDCTVVGINGERCPVWKTTKPLRRRTANLKPLHSLREVITWSEQPYVDWGLSDLTLPALTDDDLTTVFEIREVWESRFAAELSRRLSRVKDRDVALRCIEDTIDRMRHLAEKHSNATQHPQWRQHGATFHSQIAELSNQESSAERRHFAGWIYEFTKAVYSWGMTNAKTHSEGEEDVVIEEHRRIVDLIRNGQAEDVRGVIREHLVQHYDRAQQALLQCPHGSA
jgi:DNA-binding GntR family transcriptional regulator